jgi:formylmethanofuran dehydrogenase subunit D
MNLSEQISLSIVTYRDIYEWVERKKGDHLSSKYQEHSAIIYMSVNDIKKLGIRDNATVELSNDVGRVVVRAKDDKSCPDGFGFMPISPYANRLTGYNPSKAQFPDFKSIKVMVKPTEETVSPPQEGE